MRSHAYIVALGLALCSPVTQGYEEPTHQTITEAAVGRSVLQASPGVLQDLELEPKFNVPEYGWRAQNGSAIIH